VDVLKGAGVFLIVALLSPAAGGAQGLPATGDAAAAAQAGAPQGPAAGPSFPRLVLIDLRDVLGAPLSWHRRQWGLFSLGVAGVGAAALLDEEVRDREQGDHNHRADQIADVFEPLGSYGAFGVLGSFYVAGLVRDDSRARSVAEDGLAASIIAGGIITPALKYAAGRLRPRDTEKTFDFSPFSGNASFPSGHVTEAFAVASVIATQYDAGWVKGVAYGSAALVGFARIHHQAHFLSDVTAGALIGKAVGRAVVHRNDEERRRFTVAPILGPRNQPGMAMVLSF
jgi:membrane-associated phospholipid phosphatase